jgi:hypothetical protein
VKINITAITICQLIAASHSIPAANAGLGGMLALGLATGWRGQVRTGGDASSRVVVAAK